jgi:hypothetical protein
MNGEIKKNGLKKTLPFAIFLISLAYYVGLCAKSWTWIFVSGDSGDWLASSIWWFVPQPLGSPLFLFLGHLLNLFPGDLVLKETILLSCLPAALTVTLIYLITTHLASWKYGIIAALMTLGTGIFLTQSTVIEEYALATMFLVLAYWLYLRNAQKLILVALGCATAIHVVVLPITLFWFYIERKEWKSWLKLSWIYILFGISPYLLVPVLMWLESPPLITGYWSFANLKEYVFNTAGIIVGQISIFDFPLRFLRYCTYLLSGLGLGLIGLLWATHKPIPRHITVLIMIIAFTSWYYLTNLDPSTWTYLVYTVPFIAVLACLGLASTPKPILIRLAVVSSIVLIGLNSFWLNADLLTRQEPLATEYKQSLEAMPANSVVLIRPGVYSLGLFYVMAESRPDLAPIIFWETEEGLASYDADYRSWLKTEYNLQGKSILSLIADALSQHRNVYIAEDYEKTQYAAVHEIKGMENWTMLLSQLVMLGESDVRQIKNIF